MSLTPGRRRRVLSLAAVLAVAVAGTPSASASIGPAGRAAAIAAAGDSPPTTNQPFDACTDTDGRPFATGLPALPCLPLGGEDQPTRWQDFGAPFDDIDQTVAKPKIHLSLPLTLGRTFFLTCTQTTAEATNPCPVGYGIPITSDPEYAGWFGLAAAVYLQSPLGDPQQYGHFAPVHAQLLAFGALPVTATVSVAQQVVDGTVSPLLLAWASSASDNPQGFVYPSYPQYGAAPLEGGNTFRPEAHVRGPITVTLSDVAVDGVPLPVGTTCRTTTDLDLGAPGGWILSDVPTRGQPGAYNPVAPYPSYLTAQLDLPAFSGCRNGAEDVSPLVTGLVSGPDNTLDVTQTQSLLPYACLPAFTDTCYGQHPVVVDPRTIPVPAN